MKKTIKIILLCILAIGYCSQVGYAIDHPYGNYLVIKYLLDLNDFAAAEALIDKHLAENPQDPFILTEKANLLHRAYHQTDKALPLLERAIAVYPEYYYANYLMASILYGQSREDAEKVKRALLCLDNVIKNNPQFYDGHFLKAAILGDQGKFEESNRCFEKANRIKPTIRAYLFMATNYQQLKNREQEIEAYRKVLKLSPANYTALNAIARYYIDKHDFKNAVLFLEKLYERNPDDQRITFQYLYSLFVNGENDKFLELTQGLDLSNSPPLLYARALALSRVERFEEASKLLESLSQKTVEDKYLLAEIYLRQDNNIGAYELLDTISPDQRDGFYYSLQLLTLLQLNLNQRIISLYNEIKVDASLTGSLSSDDYYSVIFANANRGKLEEVLSIANHAQTHIKDNREADFSNLIRNLQNFKLQKVIETPEKLDRGAYIILTLYKKEQRYDLAISMLTHLSKKVSSADISMEICELYRKQGKIKKAEKLLEKMQKDFPNSLQVKNFSAYFLAQQNKNLEFALQLSAQTLALQKDSCAYLDTYGYILLRLGRIDEAQEYLFQAYQKNPFDEEIIAHLVDLYRQKNQIDVIIEIYKRAIDNGVDFKDRLTEELKILYNERKQKEKDSEIKGKQ